jgi:hypothetical protein
MSAPANSKPVASVSPSPSATSAPVAPVALTPKEAKLAELLAVYKADKLTPHQYQDQRAKILSE